MATNRYFNNFSEGVINEQRLLEDLIVETTQIHGHDIYYIVRENYNDIDEVFGEMAEAKYERAYLMEMYIANVAGFEGDLDFFSKFGLEVRDTSNFVVPRRTFERYVPSTTAIRPREGDLIYVPLMKKLFEIKFVEDELLFFSLGKRAPYMYELRAEAIRYAQGDLNTGVSEIDDLEEKIAYTVALTVSAGSGNFQKGEIVFQGANVAYATAKGEVKEWISSNGHLEVINVMGDFTDGQTLRGNTSNVTYTVSVSDEIGDYVDFDDFENLRIQTEADNFIDLSEINPFGIP